METIIVKYLSKSASTEEMIALTIWLKKESNSSIFEDFIRTNYLIDFNMLDFDTEGEKKKLLKRIEEREKNKHRRIVWEFFKYAAVLIVAIGLGYILNTKNNNSPTEENQNVVVEIDNNIQPGKDKAILTLEDGSEVVLEKGKQTKLKGISHNEDKLVYNNNSAEKYSVQYNHLTIPKGGQFFVQLSDGTKVWLNSDSKLKYPVSFIKGQSRNIELLYGEAYFDVSSSTNHDGANFMVQTGIQEIQVLGTEFNVKAYQDESNIVTTLVEGKVTIDNGTQETFLKPSEQSIVDLKNSEITIKKVNKVFDEIAWKEGYFSFKSKTMKEIMKILSRWYDIEYVFKDSKKEEKKFTGVLDRESTIDQILINIQKTNEINFQIYDKTVIIE
ncbi:FecR family protein [Maribacter sp. 2304DJ31-5]|uniref:FecR family protein n=1 Tax=Maribacter sp. 2304DJ31-5 TaxID=3386273 RepID=UPI0039BC55CA